MRAAFPVKPAINGVAMKPSYDYDLIVIGAGIAGMVSAVTANALGRRVAVVERSRVGGNCTNTTCIPSKTLIHLGRLSRNIAHLDRLGLLASPAAGLNPRMVMPHIRSVTEKAYQKDAPETFEAIGIRMIEASARFIDDHRIQADERVLSAHSFIIAAGTVPFIPPVDGIGDIDFLTNETLYQLDTLPGSLIILGGGVDGLEYASAFAHMGVRTTVIEMATRLLPQMDLELVNHLLRGLRREGVNLLAGAKAAKLSRRDGRVVLAYDQESILRREVQADRLLVAVGRRPALEALSLENAHVQYNARGILTDDRLRTTASHIYACGDVVGPYQLASSAEAQAIVAATNAVLPLKRRIDYRNSIAVMFTEPPLACIGLTEEQAHEAYGDKLKVYRFAYANMRRALIDGHSEGVAKLLCDGRGRIVGAHILGEGAGEVIHEIQVVRAFKKPLRRLQFITHAYPTYAQALAGRASQLAFLDRMAESLLVRIALRLLPGCANRLHTARERLAESGPPLSRVETERPAGALKTATSRSPGGGAPTAPVPEKAPCRITPRTVDQQTLTLDIAGSLDAACETALLSAFDHSARRAEHILLNFSGLVHMDPEGASHLLAGAVRAARMNRTISAVGLQAGLRDVLQLTSLDQVMALHDGGGQAGEAPDPFGQTGPPAGGPPPGLDAPFAGWAMPVDRILLKGIPPEAMNLNVEGRRTAGPADGFGQLWDKRYRLRLSDPDISPEQAVALWKAAFPSFWPRGNRLFASDNGAIVPGTPALLNLRLPGGLTLATGIMVIYTDDTAFTFMTVDGHMLSGWIHFSSFREDAATVIQVHPLFRAGDPLMELGFRLGGARQEDAFWQATLANLARRLGTWGQFEERHRCIDRRMNWRKAGRLWHSAAIRSSVYMPLHLFGKLFHRRKKASG